MALVKKGTGAVLLAAALMAILLLFSAASLYSSSTMSPTRASRHQRRQQQHARIIYYRTYTIILRKPPNANAMDEDAHRRWHQSFLPSILTDSGEPRLLDSYYRYVRYGIYAFSTRLTVSEIEVVAKKPCFLGSRHWRPTRGYLAQEAGSDCDPSCAGAAVSKPAATASQK
ncbi:hypothetical protein PAHAL_6G140900 [Panicum hallii]|uniref:Inhibitor I9 domain-containing protein n=1 Tax=Panicum hallii TaxID=206008 RepID=A0A2S3I211_9POAL|nr:hypothetical protein PAHAL_6G140900 [Panicum hallii]